MEELYGLGIDDDSIKNMFEICPNITDLSREEVKEKIDILAYFECNERQQRNIIESNPNYLDRMTSDILGLIKKLQEVGFDCLNILFDSNPYILNLDAFEIENYINDKINEGYSLEDIVDELDSNPSLFNEI